MSQLHTAAYNTSKPLTKLTEPALNPLPQSSIVNIVDGYGDIYRQTSAWRNRDSQTANSTASTPAVANHQLTFGGLAHGPAQTSSRH